MAETCLCIKPCVLPLATQKYKIKQFIGWKLKARFPSCKYFHYSPSYPDCSHPTCKIHSHWYFYREKARAQVLTPQFQVDDLCNYLFPRSEMLLALDLDFNIQLPLSGSPTPPSEYLVLIFILLCVYMWLCVCLHWCIVTYTDIRGKLTGIGALFLPCRSLGLNTGWQA